MKVTGEFRKKMTKAVSAVLAVIMAAGMSLTPVLADNETRQDTVSTEESCLEEVSSETGDDTGSSEEESVHEALSKETSEEETSEEAGASENNQEALPEAEEISQEEADKVSDTGENLNEEAEGDVIESISLSMGSNETEKNFTWYSKTNTVGTVSVVPADDLSDGMMPETAAVFTATVREAKNKAGYYSYQATVSSLTASTTYAYQIAVGETKSELHTFTAGSAASFSFAFAGDPQIGASGNTVSDTDGWDKTLSLLNDKDELSGVDFMLSAGDQVNTANNEDQYNGYLNHETLSDLPVATLVGNHDFNSAAYDEHFNVPNESTYGSTAAGGDYYFVYNHVLFLALNSNNRSTAEHKAFMEEAIAATADQDITWKIATFHHSIYSVANHASEPDILERRNQLAPVFKELDIDVVLMGHDHVYCRTYMMDGLTPMTDASLYDDDSYSSITNPEGILYVTANSASGSKFYNIQQNVDFDYSYVMNQERVPNISRVDVSDEAFTITTYRTSDMSVVDTFTINHEKEYVNVYGDNRYETAVSVARETYPQGSSTVVLVKGNDFPDALAANAYAGTIEAPVLMTDTDKLNENVRALLTGEWKDTVKKVVILGDGMDSSVIKELRNDCGLKVVKVAGRNRYETAEKIAEAVYSRTEVDTVFVATGLKAADALSASSWSYELGYPILLADSTGKLRESSENFIKNYDIEHVILLGDENVVSTDCACGLDYVRLGGMNRYETSVKIADYFTENGYGTILTNTGFACGTEEHFADALVGGQLMGRLHSAILLTSSSDTVTPSYVAEKIGTGGGSAAKTFYFLGYAAEGLSDIYDRLVDAIEGRI